VNGRVGVVGLSHLGIVSSSCLAATGVPVTAVDGDAGLVAALAAGTPPIHEPGLLPLLTASRPTFTPDYSVLQACELVIFAVDTATDDQNRSDLSGLEAHLERALPWLPRDGVVALMSQVPVGYTRALDARLRAHRPDLRARLYYWVETLVIGEAVARFREPERIIIGGPSSQALPEPALDALLARFRCPVFRMNYETAELAKAAINFYLSVSVTFANTLADLCEATGASMRAILPALRSDRRIGQHSYIRPSLGITGGNLERDLVHLKDLADKTGVDASLICLLLDHSTERYGWLLRTLEHHFLTRDGRARLAVWGLAYKKNTRSTKNSVALRLIHDLHQRATLVVYDPEVKLSALPPGLEVASTPDAALKGADGLVILTDWDEFIGFDLRDIGAALRRPVVVDAVGALDSEGARAAGLTYVAIGEGV
jgi:UDPglucose 6-dehydrogenase